MNKILGLEGLRAYMAVWVFVTHVLTMASFPLYKGSGLGVFLANGAFAVNVFIMLSGFVITFLLKKREMTYRKFIAQRALRLFPAYIFCLLVSVCILGISQQVLHDIPWRHEKMLERLQIFADTESNYWTHLFLHLGLLHGLVPERLLHNTSFAFMGQAWSLSLEWQFYLVSPFIIGLFSKRYPQARLAFVAVSLMCATLLAMRVMPQGSFLLSKLPLFFAGIVCSLAYIASSNGELEEQYYFLIIFVVAMLMSFDGYNGVSALIWMISLFSLSVADVSSASGGRPGAFGLVMKWVALALTAKWVLWMGKISYSFYCFHMISIYCMAYFLVDIVGIHGRWEYAGILIVSSFVLTVICSALIYRFIEEPAIRLGRKL